MTPNDDHRSLFLSSSAADAAEDGQRPADESDEAMRRLRDPFAVTPEKGDETPAETRRDLKDSAARRGR